MSTGDGKMPGTETTVVRPLKEPRGVVKRVSTWVPASAAEKGDPEEKERRNWKQQTCRQWAEQIGKFGTQVCGTTHNKEGRSPPFHVLVPVERRGTVGATIKWDSGHSGLRGHGGRVGLACDFPQQTSPEHRDCCALGSGS